MLIAPAVLLIKLWKRVVALREVVSFRRGLLLAYRYNKAQADLSGGALSVDPAVTG